MWTSWFYFGFPSSSPQGWHWTVSWSPADEPLGWVSLIQMCWQFISPSVCLSFCLSHLPEMELYVLPLSWPWVSTLYLYHLAELSLIGWYNVNVCERWGGVMLYAGLLDSTTYTRKTSSVHIHVNYTGAVVTSTENADWVLWRRIYVQVCSLWVTDWTHFILL